MLLGCIYRCDNDEDINSFSLVGCLENLVEAVFACILLTRACWNAVAGCSDPVVHWGALGTPWAVSSTLAQVLVYNEPLRHRSNLPNLLQPTPLHMTWSGYCL